MSPPVVGIIGTLGVLILMALRMPIALALILVGFSGFAYLTSPGAACLHLASGTFAHVFDYIYAVIPFFVFMGAIVSNSSISERLFDTAYKWVGQFRGGLAMATIVGCALFAAVCGSSTATSATMCRIAFPEMERYKYKPALSAGSIGTGGTLGILIPPSLGFIIFAILTETSIGDLFMAGIIPGIIHASLYLIVIIVWTSLDPGAGPSGPAVGIRQKLASLGGTGEILVLFSLVMGGMFIGWFTPSEAGAVGAIGALIIALSRKMLNWQQFTTALKETLQIAGMIILLVVGGSMFATFIAMSRLPFELADMIVRLPFPPLGIMLAILLSYFVLGCLMDLMVLLMISVPIYFPLVLALGFDPVWFGVITVVMIEIALITPPIGLNVWVVSGMIKHIPMETIFKGVLIFLSADLALVSLLVAFPQITIFLPSLMK